MMRWSVFVLLIFSLALVGCPTEKNAVGKTAENASSKITLDIDDEGDDELSGAPLLENKTKSGVGAKKFKKKKKIERKLRFGKDGKSSKKRRERRERIEYQRKRIMDELNEIEEAF